MPGCYPEARKRSSPGCPKLLTGLFAISGYSGKASERFLGGFGGVFLKVFGQITGQHFTHKSSKIPLNPFKSPLKAFKGLCKAIQGYAYRFFPIFSNFGLYFIGFLAIFLEPFGFRKAREAGSCYVSTFHPNPTTGVRVMMKQLINIWIFYRFLVENLVGKLIDNCQKNTPNTVPEAFPEYPKIANKPVSKESGAKGLVHTT